MRTLTLLSVILAIASTCHGQLLFKSGFEDAVSLTPYFPENTIWRRNITGTDSTTGFTWPGDLPGEREPIFQFVLGKEARFDDFVTTKIETVPGRDGKPTKALFLEVIKEWDNDL